MLKYLAKRIGRSLITLFFIISLVFCLMRQMPVEGYFKIGRASCRERV